jgi:hypothetical protein
MQNKQNKTPFQNSSKNRIEILEKISNKELKEKIFDMKNNGDEYQKKAFGNVSQIWICHNEYEINSNIVNIIMEKKDKKKNADRSTMDVGIAEVLGVDCKNIRTELIEVLDETRKRHCGAQREYDFMMENMIPLEKYDYKALGPYNHDMSQQQNKVNEKEIVLNGDRASSFTQYVNGNTTPTNQKTIY